MDFNPQVQITPPSESEASYGGAGSTAPPSRTDIRQTDVSEKEDSASGSEASRFDSYHIFPFLVSSRHVLKLLDFLGKKVVKGF